MRTKPKSIRIQYRPPVILNSTELRPVISDTKHAGGQILFPYCAFIWFILTKPHTSG